MSKRQSSIFNFFSPKSAKKVTESPKTQSNEKEIPSTPKASKVDNNVINSDSDNDEVIGVKKRKITYIRDDDSSEDENIVKKSKVSRPADSDTENERKTTNEKLSKFAACHDINQESNTNNSNDGARSIVGQKAITSASTPSRKTKQSNGSDTRKIVLSNDDLWLHETLPFLNPDKIKDKYQRSPSDPDYDCHTLFVPDSFLNSLTPAMRQWWILKSNYFDSILFFKVGKFYELYHMDAVTGVNALNLTFMKGSFAHSGFPETAYGKMSKMLVDKGYKVARVEQTETPEMMAGRCQKSKSVTKFDKVVNREVCQLTSLGTCVSNIQDANSHAELGVYMLAIYEEINDSFDNKTQTIHFGVCFVETSIGKFYLGQFEDDIHRSKLLTLLAHYPPVLVLYPKNQLSVGTRNIFKNTEKYLVEPLVPKKQFLEVQDVIKKIVESQYFTNEDGDIVWPEALKEVFEGNGMAVQAKSEYFLAANALGGVLWYLSYSHLDIQLMQMRKFKLYQPTEVALSGLGSHMIMDAVTLKSLRILDGEWSLFKKLDYCSSPFGKRLLRQWVSSPLCNLSQIKERQKAIQELLDHPELIRSARSLIHSLPDLDRALARIHALGNKTRSQLHPDSRAIFYEDKTYSKKKIKDFMVTIKGFEKATKIVDMFKDIDLSNNILRRCTKELPKGQFPDIISVIEYFKDAFDLSKAEQFQAILPERGVDEEYDDIIDEIKQVEEELESYRKEQEKYFRCKVVYFGNDKKRYQLEVPAEKASNASDEYMLEGAKKGSHPVKRYSTPTTKAFLARMMAAEQKKKNIVKDLCRRVFEKFSENYQVWNAAVECLSVLDVLLSFAEYYSNQSTDMCIPELYLPDDNRKPYIKITEGKHPTIANVETWISNDTVMGTDDCSPVLILSGPNMGGKSSYMRQSALLVVLAQIGCHVPAKHCEFTLVDRVFTRVGASDDIIFGSSTFCVELNETNSILTHATANSFAIIDEFGRGTSTYDGTSIAHGVINYVAEHKFRTIFSTHYHQLVKSYIDSPIVSLGHMASLREDDLPNKKKVEGVVLIYRLEKGPSPQSFGFDAALKAGLPNNIIERALVMSDKFVKSINAVELFQELMAKNSTNNIYELARMIISKRS